MGAAVALALAFTACASSFSLYREDLFAGRKFLAQGEFEKARNSFIKASTEAKRSPAFVFAATASYKMGDLASAESYIYEAERSEGATYVTLRILGYKALILLKEGRKEEGFVALRAYINYYKRLYPLMTIERVESMGEKGEVDQAALEKLLDEQINNFESELQQASTTGTGYYSTRLPPAPGFMFFMPD